MLKIDLNKAELELLRDIMEYDYKELRNEISNTENWKFKEGLKQKELVIQKILAAL